MKKNHRFWLLALALSLLLKMCIRDRPNTTLDATFIHDGDTVRLFFTNKYIPVDPDEPVDPGTEVPNFDKVSADTKKYIQNNVPAPVVASDRGEWAVLGLARCV